MIADAKLGTLPIYLLIVAVLPHEEGIGGVLIICAAILAIHLIQSLMLHGVARSVGLRKSRRKKLLETTTARTFIWLAIVLSYVVGAGVLLHLEVFGNDVALGGAIGLGALVLAEEVRYFTRFLQSLPESVVNVNGMARTLYNLMGLITKRTQIVEVIQEEAEAMRTSPQAEEKGEGGGEASGQA